MESDDISRLIGLLKDVLNPDNTARKAAEQLLLSLKVDNPDGYWYSLFAILSDTNNKSQIRVLWAVFLRSAFLSNLGKDKNLWVKISIENREYIYTEVLNLISNEEDVQVINALSNLISEIIGSLYELEDQVRWKEPHELWKELIDKQNSVNIIAALNIYIGMFDKIAEQMMKYKNDLMKVFQFTIGYSDKEVALLGMKAAWKIIISLERKDSSYFKDILNNIFDLAQKELDEMDEDLLEKILIELKELAGAEPMFFMNNFDYVFSVLEKIMQNKTYEKPTIRILPIELLSTIVVRLKTKFKKNMKAVKKIVAAIYNTMRTIDDEISDEWLNPEDGCKIEEEEFSIDPVHVGSKWIDSFIRELGATKMKPIVQELIEAQFSSKKSTWQEIHSWLMIIALLGEYMDNINDAEPFVEIAIKYLIHENPKVRYSAIHTIGQMSTDLQPAFQAQFWDKLLAKLITWLSDRYPRLQAHAWASLTNFLEGATDDLIENHIKELCVKLLYVIENGNTMWKENGITWLATVAEAAETKFGDYYCDVIKSISKYLTPKIEDIKYYQFQGQLIEAVVIMSVSIGYEYFKDHADGLIKLLLEIQNKIFDEVRECSESVKSTEHHILQAYLLTAWEKLWYLMGKDFAPYLDEIVPNLLLIASLNPKFKTSENEVLIHNDDDDEQSNLVTSEIDEK